MIDIRVPGENEPIRMNRYIVSRGDNQSAVVLSARTTDTKRPVRFVIGTNRTTG
jgi:hypothetical protein